MNTKMKRLATGGRIDRSKPITLTFDGKSLTAFEGDTLASALLAHDILLIGRSFKYHRPRGLYSAGVEEPNALVHLGEGPYGEPNARATMIEAFNDLTAKSQNAWPHVGFDIGALNNLLSPFFSAGFYYKTFIGPFQGTQFWMFCEHFIRKAAGMGKANTLEDPDHYEKRHAFCDVLVIGGGVAGLTAALAAGRAGAQVILAEQDFELGGRLLSEPIDGEGAKWLRDIVTELQAMENIRILTRTSVFGAYDGDTYGLIERNAQAAYRASIENSGHPLIRERYWQVHATRSILASGAIERPLLFAGNDKPGVMLAGAVRHYLNRFSVLAGKKVLVCANNDSAYLCAIDMARAGADVTLADMRQSAADEIIHLAQDAGVTLLLGHAVLKAKGWQRVQSAILTSIDDKGRAFGDTHSITCDVIAISGGWTPAIHLWSQHYGKPTYDAETGCFLPASKEEDTMQAAGSVLAVSALQQIISESFKLGKEVAGTCKANQDSGPPPDDFTYQDRLYKGINSGVLDHHNSHSLWAITNAKGRYPGKAFIDLQHDVKVSDIDQAHREGYISVEHLKRYTTSGMATDQGKLSNINAITRMAQLQERPMPEVGTTTFRPPFTPITIGAIVGHNHGLHFRPTRLSPIHHWHEENGAKMTEAGAWKRPWYYSRNSGQIAGSQPSWDCSKAHEDLQTASIREAQNVRQNVGIVDVSTLGKIAIQGPDAVEFLNRIYVNGWKTLQIGRLRYGVMLRDDGFVMDDGATACIGDYDYFMTTTTANAAKVIAFAEYLLQTAWQDMRVHVTSITDQYAAIAVAGPQARNLLSTVVKDADISRETMPNNHWTYGTIGGMSVRIHRMSYSGELAYEVYIPAGYGRYIWECLYQAGQDFGLLPYGTEAMGILRIEKGHIAGPEIEGRTTLKDLGLHRFASSKKAFVGSILRQRPYLEVAERPTLVGLEIEGERGAKAGSLLFPLNGEMKGHGDGWVSSATFSPALSKYIAMGLLKNGQERMGEIIHIANFTEDDVLSAKVISHHFFDPEGERQNG